MASRSFLTLSGLSYFKDKIISIIEDNNYVIETAITDLNERLLIVENNNSESIITEDDITAWGFTKNIGTITGITMNGTSKGTSGVVDLGTVITAHQDISGKADDNEVVHKNGTETITGVKTFNSGVHFLGSGDSNAVTLSTNTRINVNGTTKTVLGFGSGTFYINHGDYSLLLRGKNTRPTYNSSELALFSDVNNKQDTLVSGTNIKTINGSSIVGSGDITISSGEENVQSDWNVTDTSSDAYIKNKPSIGNITAIDTSETLEDVDTATYIKYVAQTLTDAQKSQARTNINANETLISGTNIKTINGTSLLGSGNIVIEGGSSGEENVQSDWNATDTSSDAYIKNKPTFAAVATSGSYNDLSNKPTIPSAVTIDTTLSTTSTNPVQNKVVTAGINAKYTKPSTGIPKSDLASAVQTSLGKADTALQSETYTGTITQIKANGTSIATSGVANIPAASTSAYGVTKLSSSTSSTSTTLAATASAVKAAYDLANSKQATLVSGTNIKTINGTSLLGSGNIVISGGGGDSGGSSAYSEVSHGTSDTTFTLTPNTFHVWDEVTSLTLTLGDETAGVANEFLFQFNSGSTATTLTLPDTIKWANDSALTIEANKIYQISILKGLASVLVFDNEPAAVLITFTVDGTEYQAEEGMTWSQWVSSPYSNGVFRVQGTMIWSRMGDIVGISYSDYVNSNDEIIENTSYILIPAV